MATAYDLVLILAKDQGLAADTRMAIARKASLFGPSRSMHNRAAAANGHGRPSSEMGTRIGPDHEANKRTAPKRKAGLATDLLFAVAQDIAAAPADRRKAASQVAEFFLPKSARGTNVRRGEFPPDEYGFVVDPELATELRDSKLKLACLNLAKKRTPYAIAQKARTLNARNRGDPEITPMSLSFKIRP
jgi:hypothetical protein